MTARKALVERLAALLGPAYRVERELPGGGMSRLFYIADLVRGAPAVAKVLPPELASAVNEARFRREMDFAAQLRHPNILPVLFAGGGNGVLFYVMPFVAGESLEARIKRDRVLGVPHALAILHAVAGALVYAHEQGVLHRDIKPANVLLDGERVFLTDFGIARALTAPAARPTEDLVTAPGLAPGTPGYMAPEHLAGSAELDARTDQYSLAVVGFEMLTGRPPFTAMSLPGMRRAQSTQQAPALRSLRPDAPRAVARAIDRALSKLPRDRFPSVQAFRDALDADGDATRFDSASRPRWVTRWRNWLRSVVIPAGARDDAASAR